MPATAEQVIQIALKYVGVRETPPGSNITPFTEAYFDGHLPANPAASAPWCVIFGWYVFREAGASELLCNGAKVGSCSAVLRWASANRLTVAKDQTRRGDILLFDWDQPDTVPDHFGRRRGRTPYQGSQKRWLCDSAEIRSQRRQSIRHQGGAASSAPGPPGETQLRRTTHGYPATH